MRSLQARMFLVFALIATLPLLAMSYLALNATRDALEGEMGRANGDAAKAAAGFVDVYVENGRVLLDAEAGAPLLREAIAADDRASLLRSAEGLRDRAAYQGTRLFRGIAVYDANGTLVAASPPESADLMGDAFHAAAVDLARTRNGSVTFHAPRTGEPVLPLLVPVYVNGTLQGVLAGDLSLVALSVGLAPFGAEHQTVFLTDADGSLLAHPDPAVLAERPDWSDVSPVRLASSSAVSRNFIEYDDPATGERALASFATIPRLGWVVVDSVPTSVAYAALQQLRGVLIALSGLLVGAILLASVGVARRIVAPVQELTAASRELAEGKLSRRVAPKGNDEIAELGRAFDQMAARISESLEGLRLSEARYRSLVESASDLIFTVQPDGQLSFVSPMMKRVLGSAIRQGSSAAELVHGDDRSAFREAVAHVLAEGEPALWVPFRLIGDSGAERAVLTNFTPVFEGGDRPARVLAVAHDVTEERRQEELREKAFQMARLVSEENALDALGHRGLLLLLSASGLDRGALFLVRSGHLKEAALANVQDARPFLELAEKARTAAKPAAGAVGTDNAVAIPLIEHGEVIGAVVLSGAVIAVDTPRYNILTPLASQLSVGLRRSLFEQRLKEYAAELESRVAERTLELTQKSDEMEQFLYTVSHDLKAPLISIQGYAQGIQEDYGAALAGDGAQFLDRIRKNATLMESLIIDILELSRIGQTREELSPVDADRLFLDISSRMSDRFVAAEGRIEIATPLPSVEGEPRRVAQLFANLVDNAIKYRHPERPPVVKVWGEESGDLAVFHIQDNGRGIPSRFHDQLFKIFQRVPAQGMEDPGGTGMGLAIVKRIADTQGGRVWFDSVEGKGTTFHVELPKRRSV